MSIEHFGFQVSNKKQHLYILQDASLLSNSSNQLSHIVSVTNLLNQDENPVPGIGNSL